MDIVHQMHFHYAEADVSAASLLKTGANMQPGDIRRCDVSKVYPYNNTLYTLEMTGAQLKSALEWSTSFYRQYQPGDLTIGFVENSLLYNLYQFEGITYAVNIANEAGKRIEGLAWPDGTPVADNDTFVLATTNYFATSSLLSPGSVFDEGEALPRLKDIDVRGDIGGIRELLVDYISNVKGGQIEPEVNGNWKLVGNDWDSAMHERAVQLLAEGKLDLKDPEQERDLVTGVITEADLAAVTG